jgi:hypothetical protein
MAILEGRFREGDEVEVGVENGQLVIRGERAPVESEVVDAEVVQA